jgi:hypothetical protein
VAAAEMANSRDVGFKCNRKVNDITQTSNEEPVKLNRGVALRLFSKVVFSQFLSQNNPLIVVGFYQNLYHHASNAKFLIDRFFI